MQQDKTFIDEKYLSGLEAKFKAFLNEARSSRRSKDLHHLNALKLNIELRGLLQKFRGRA